MKQRKLKLTERMPQKIKGQKACKNRGDLVVNKVENEISGYRGLFYSIGDFKNFLFWMCEPANLQTLHFSIPTDCCFFVWRSKKGKAKKPNTGNKNRGDLVVK